MFIRGWMRSSCPFDPELNSDPDPDFDSALLAHRSSGVHAYVLVTAAERGCASDRVLDA